ncbi:MAG: IS110 family transposase [Actinomycetota bacterium]|nr:IS110 family transposase [Actinomycetota bacterium]
MSSSSSSTIIWIGMDVHKDSVMLAVYDGRSKDPEIVEQLPNDLRKLKRFLDRWSRRGEIRACYEASGAGYVLHREITAWGYHCDIVAPSLIPVRPGDRRKHDRKDARQIGRLYSAGELVAIRIPSTAEEEVRDLVRCRQTFQREILRSRHYVTKFLARRGFVFRQGTNWTQKHRVWLGALLQGDRLGPQDRSVFSEYLALLDYKISRREDLDDQIEKLAFSDAYKPLVDRLRCFRGVGTLAAMTLVTEIGDWRRFERPGQLMAYLGLIPREHSSADRTRRGSITKAGNSRCRHVLVQAAWQYRTHPRLSLALKERQRGQPLDVIEHSWKAQHRLHKIYHRIGAKKSSNIAVVAVARELVGFLWAVMHDLEYQLPASLKDAA